MAATPSDGLLSVEYKFLDTARSGWALTAPTGASGANVTPTSGCVGCLNSPALGSSASEREGREIRMLSIELQAVVITNGTSGASSIQAERLPAAYLALVLDTQTNGATLFSAEVFKNISGTGQMAASPFLNMSNVDRYRVLKSKTIQPRHLIGQNAVNNNAANTASMNRTHVLVHMKYEFDENDPHATVNHFAPGPASVGSVVNVLNNSVYLVAYCSSIEQAPTLTFGCRVMYVG